MSKIGLKCSYQDERGRCKAYALRDSTYCNAHDPAQAKRWPRRAKEAAPIAAEAGAACQISNRLRQSGRQRMRGEIVAGLLRGDIDPDAAATADEMLQEWLKTQELIQAKQVRTAQEVAVMEELVRRMRESRRQESSSSVFVPDDQENRESMDADPSARFEPGEYKEPIATTAPHHTEPPLERMAAVGPPLPLRPIPPSQWGLIQNTPPEDSPEYAGASTVAGISDAA